ncbi:hypothetical protein BSLG_001117 [Batrachochytrium salamandrivorans]|nr:hypothetical protein BSLG_001117 [Batrachochytrium salamandrivorans]
MVPFDLTRVDSGKADGRMLVDRMLDVGKQFLDSPGKEYEGASIFIMNLSRKDSSQTHLLPFIEVFRDYSYGRGHLHAFAQGDAASSKQNVPVLTKTPITTQEAEAYDEIPDEIEDIINVLLNGLRDKDTISKITGVSDASWHGSCLALAELIRRGLLLPDRLKECIPWILRGLTFDQRKGKHSVGSHVRDAACYVCWSLARAYAPDVLAPYAMELAQSLVVVSLTDREINIRRASAAAFQENVGRHGYPEYASSIINYLATSCREHWDMDMRILSSKSIGILTSIRPDYVTENVLSEMIKGIHSQELEIRHASLLFTAEILHTLSASNNGVWPIHHLENYLKTRPLIVAKRYCRKIRLRPFAACQSLLASHRKDLSPIFADLLSLRCLQGAEVSLVFASATLETITSNAKEIIQALSVATHVNKDQVYNDAEARRNAIHALTSISLKYNRQLIQDLPDGCLGTIITTLLAGTEDYSTDSRGDVGS